MKFHLVLSFLLCLTAVSTARADAMTPRPVDGDWWKARHVALVKVAQTEKIDILFLGDSITDFWHGDGARLWARHLAPRHAANFGIGGDRIENVLWRIENGELDGLAPRVVVLLIGTNNTPNDDVETIAGGHAQLVNELRRRLPDTKILLLAVFPRVDDWSIPFRAKIGPINERLAQLAASNPAVTFLDIGPQFLSADGSMAKDVSYDGLHFTEKGYEIWLRSMMPTLGRLLGNRGLSGN